MLEGNWLLVEGNGLLVEGNGLLAVDWRLNSWRVVAFWVVVCVLIGFFVEVLLAVLVSLVRCSLVVSFLAASRLLLPILLVSSFVLPRRISLGLLVVALLRIIAVLSVAVLMASVAVSDRTVALLGEFSSLLLLVKPGKILVVNILVVGDLFADALGLGSVLELEGTLDEGQLEVEVLEELGRVALNVVDWL